MTHPEFRVLGPVEVRRDGRTLSLGDTALTISAGLLLSAGEPVSVDTMTEWVWTDRLPAHPRAALHNALSRLRRQFGPGVIETHGRSYRLVTDADHLDLLRFRRLAAAGGAEARQNRDETAADLLEEALGLWRRPVLSNVSSPTLAQDAAARLTEQYLNLQELRAQVYLRLRRHGPLVEELAGLVTAYPYRESLASLLMLAQLRAGRRADALLTYESVRAALREELGIDPGEALQTLYLQILRDHRTTTTPARRRNGPLRTG